MLQEAAAADDDHKLHVLPKQQVGVQDKTLAESWDGWADHSSTRGVLECWGMMVE